MLKTGDRGRKQVVPCLWFDNKAEEAAKFYVSVIKKSKPARANISVDMGLAICDHAPETLLPCLINRLTRFSNTWVPIVSLPNSCQMNLFQRHQFIE